MAGQATLVKTVNSQQMAAIVRNPKNKVTFWTTNLLKKKFNKKKKKNLIFFN